MGSLADQIQAVVGWAVLPTTIIEQNARQSILQRKIDKMGVVAERITDNNLRSLRKLNRTLRTQHFSTRPPTTFPLALPVRVPVSS